MIITIKPELKYTTPRNFNIICSNIPVKIFMVILFLDKQETHINISMWINFNLNAIMKVHIYKNYGSLTIKYTKPLCDNLSANLWFFVYM